ncbi:MFS transporter, partial [Candidatus Sumerlaeota bacterium]|nr:MFS transporter [Candidatus Sumerlaeota bacterium]
MVSPDPYQRRNDFLLLGVLALGHAFNDFCVGITFPMIPTLEQKFDLSLGQVAGIITFMPIVGNFSQPLAGWCVDRVKTVRLLLFTPLIVGGATLVGLASEPWQARGIFFLAGLAMGAFHPFAFVLAQTTLPRRPALATAIFISFGFLGLSTGSMVSGIWMENREFASFHFLYFMGFVIVAAFFVRGIHRIKLEDYRAMAHAPQMKRKRSAAGAGKSAANPVEAPPEHAAAHRAIPFGLLYLLALLMAFEGGTLVFFVPKLFDVLYGSEGLGGQATFLFGLLGGLMSYLWAYLADRGNVFRVAMYVQMGAILPLIGFFFFTGASAKMIMIVFIAFTVGGTFPLMASLARDARGMTLGLRTSFIFGGIWGMSSLISLLMAQLPGPELELQRVMSTICAAPFVLVVLLGFAARR